MGNYDFNLGTPSTMAVATNHCMDSKSEVNLDQTVGRRMEVDGLGFAVGLIGTIIHPWRKQTREVVLGGTVPEQSHRETSQMGNT